MGIQLAHAGQNEEELFNFLKFSLFPIMNY